MSQIMPENSQYNKHQRDPTNDDSVNNKQRNENPKDLISHEQSSQTCTCDASPYM